MQRSQEECIKAALAVLGSLYDRSPERFDAAVVVLRQFSLTEEERLMPADELACLVINRNLPPRNNRFEIELESRAHAA